MRSSACPYGCWSKKLEAESGCIARPPSGCADPSLVKRWHATRVKLSVYDDLVGRDDWFHGMAWDPAARELFDRKLARARSSSRAQYLRIKGVGLCGSSELATRKAGRELLRRVDEYPEDVLQVTMANADLGTSLMGDGVLEEAAERFRSSMAGLPNVHCGADVGLAETILLADWTALYDEAALALAGSSAPSNPFPASRFRWHLAAARLAQRSGHVGEAREHAVDALRCLDLDESPFPRHRKLGLASTNDPTLAELRRLSGTA